MQNAIPEEVKTFTGIGISSPKVTLLCYFLLEEFKRWFEELLLENLELGELLEQEKDIEKELLEAQEYLFRNSNALAILREIIFKTGLKQVDIAARTGILKQHISEICSELDARKLIDKNGMKASALAMKFYRRNRQLFSQKPTEQSNLVVKEINIGEGMG